MFCFPLLGLGSGFQAWGFTGLGGFRDSGFWDLEFRAHGLGLEFRAGLGFKVSGD